MGNILQRMERVRKRVEKRQGGKAEDVLEAIITTQLLLSVDQEFFKELLTPIYGSTHWPSAEKLLEPFTTYAANTDVVMNISNEHADGKVSAYAVEPRLANHNNSNTRECYNCGTIGHKRYLFKKGISKPILFPQR